MCFYFYECSERHAKYALGQVIKLIIKPIPMANEQAEFAAKNHVGFVTDEPQHDH